MDINQLDKFLNYNIEPNLQPQEIVDEIILKSKSYLSKNAAETIQQTYEFAKRAHEGQMRLSGEPYIVHPLKATLILLELKPDLASIQTCILHDVIEDTPITPKEVKDKFGEEVASLCEGLVKVSKVRYKGEDRHLETIKKTFLAMAQDLRVIFVKLADRIHNMQTLHYHPKENKRRNIANETMKIYVQIAKRLGLYQYQVTLENACFKILHPEEFENITKHLKKNFALSDKYIKRGTAIISKLLQKEGLDSNFKVKGRIKSPYRIWEKMKYKYNTTDVNSIMDLLAFRIITDNVNNCYSILGIIHKHYTPLIKKIKDYIAIPKFNGYKSIHTTILGMFRFPIEIQIRTEEMDEIAEYGVAAHYAYSDRHSKSHVNQKQAEWMQRLQKLVNAYTASESKDQFKNKLDIEILNKETFIYTPKGDIIEIPKGSTVLDFAFHIHTEIGLKFKNAIVNGEIVPITHVPNTGDIVKINTFRYKYTASKQRVSILNTPSAKYKVQKYLKQESQEELLKKSTNILNDKLRDLKLPELNSKENKINHIINKKELLQKLLEAIDNKNIYTELIKISYPETYKNVFTNIKKTDTKPIVKKANIIIDDNTNLNFEMCPECNPKPGDKIIAKTGRHGIKIHTTKCRSMKTIAYTKLIEAHREGEHTNNYNVRSIINSSKNFNFLQLLELFDQLNISINRFSIKDGEENTKTIKIDRNTSNLGQIGIISQNAKKLTKSIKIVKQNIQ